MRYVAKINLTYIIKKILIILNYLHFIEYLFGKCIHLIKPYYSVECLVVAKRGEIDPNDFFFNIYDIITMNHI